MSSSVVVSCLTVSHYHTRDALNDLGLRGDFGGDRLPDGIGSVRNSFDIMKDAAWNQGEKLIINSGYKICRDYAVRRVSD